MKFYQNYFEFDDFSTDKIDKTKVFRKENYTVKSINKKTAEKIIVESHYLHTKAPISAAYGLFYKDVIAGAITFGSPTSPRVANILGKEHSRKMYELNRLYCYDWTPRNSESYFISNAIKLLQLEHPAFKILISYADTAAGHVGLVYQATNWIYTGTGFQGGGNIVIDGKKYHRRTINSKYGTSDIKVLSKMLPGADIKLSKLSVKHRYFKFIGSKKENKELLRALKYPILPYPKTTIA